jgi:hypothetical protein
MSFQDAFESAVLGLLLNGSPIANVADNAASSPLTNLHLALHTADPGEAGAAQTTSEANYPGYARLAVARSPGTPQWTLTGASPTTATCGQRVFPASTGAGTTNTHWSLGTAASGTGAIIFKGSLAAAIPIPASPPTSPTITPTIQLD